MNTFLPEYFINKNFNEIADADYSAVPQYITAIETMANLSHKRVVLLDLLKNRVLHIGGPSYSLSGISKEDIIKFWDEYAFSNKITDTMKRVNYLRNAWHLFFAKVSTKDLPNHSVVLTHNIKIQKRSTLLSLWISPLRFSLDRRLWLATCLIDLSVSRKAEQVRLFSNATLSHYHVFRSNCWKKVQVQNLSENEKDVLRLATFGHTSDEIADILKRSRDSIKNDRKNIMDKLQTGNITEAAAFATRFGVI